MNKEKLSELIINGISSAPGGTYDSVVINGVSTIGDPLAARVFKGNGHIHLNGDLAAGELECKGTINVKGNVRCGIMKAEGMLEIKGGLSGEHCSLNGLMRVHGDCELEDFKGEGAFTIDGMLSAGHMDFRLHGSGKAREIGVESIVIRQANKGVWSKLWGGIFPKFKPELLAGTIEGDNIDLEYTTAEIVRGNAVIIGEGCSIGLVEYRSKLTVHPGAIIGKEEKIGD
ncbi:hypothetical protein PaeBR_11230 [Paenibacillus sp. BR2-3]|uniref:hypothetical protein n=1 Tax=Paenibacillus sp. BR2-3 TaxID=3048494 RepID=UPI00397764EA